MDEIVSSNGLVSIWDFIGSLAHMGGMWVVACVLCERHFQVLLRVICVYFKYGGV